MKMIALILFGLFIGPVGIGAFDYGRVADLVFYCTLGFLFESGLESRLPSNSSDFKIAFLLAFGSFCTPLALSLISFSLLDLAHGPLAWILSAALSVSALPVIVEILREQDLLDKPLGKHVVTAASLCDLAVCGVFLFFLSGRDSATWIQSHVSIAMFFAGALIAKLDVFPRPLRSFLKVARTYALGPIFFISIGLHDFKLADFNFRAFILILALATVTKIAGSLFAARLAGLTKKEAWISSVALNARGAVEILMASIAFRAGLIDVNWLATLTALAITTSLIAPPWIRLLKSRS